MTKIRALLPWVIAGGFCTAFTLIILNALGNNLLSALPPLLTTAGGTPREERQSAYSPGEGTVSLLSLVPAPKRQAPLVAAMIENHEDARPHQKGLKEAIVVFEMIVEGDISRFMAIFRADQLPKRIGPIRSLRPHFVSVARGYHPLLLHAGGSAIAYQALERFPDLLNHDGLRYDGETYQRDPSAEAPHNLFIDRGTLLSVLEKYAPRDEPLPLFETTSLTYPSAESARKIEIDFKGEKHNVTFQYKPFSGTYGRSIYGAKKQAHPKNVVVLETYAEGVGEPGTIPWTQTFGEGKLLLFTKGKKWEGSWKRAKGERFQFFDVLGNVLSLSPGQVWITLLPSFERVEWK